MEPGGLRRPNSADSWVPPHMRESQCFYVSFWPEHVCTPCDWGGGCLLPESSEGPVLQSCPTLNPSGPAQSSAQRGTETISTPHRARRRLHQGWVPPPVGTAAHLGPCRCPPKGAQRCLLLLCLWSAEALFGLSKPSLGSRGLSRREVAGRGHFSMFGLVCFRKFPRVSTRKLFHCLSVSLSNPCPWELGSGPFCSGAISRG